jgi:hypothetical protein
MIEKQISKRADRQVGKTTKEKTGRRNCNIKMGAFNYTFSDKYKRTVLAAIISGMFCLILKF